LFLSSFLPFLLRFLRPTLPQQAKDEGLGTYFDPLAVGSLLGAASTTGPKMGAGGCVSRDENRVHLVDFKLVLQSNQILVPSEPTRPV
jgi:hypothetical protein